MHARELFGILIFTQGIAFIGILIILARITLQPVKA
jgi:hypothetical protein